MLSAFEQMNKNIAVVAMVAEWAKRLGRTFVEPVYCRSRVVPPFASLQEGGPVLMKALALPKSRELRDPRQWSCPGHAKERLGATRAIHAFEQPALPGFASAADAVCWLQILESKYFNFFDFAEGKNTKISAKHRQNTKIRMYFDILNYFQFHFCKIREIPTSDIRFHEN